MILSIDILFNSLFLMSFFNFISSFHKRRGKLPKISNNRQFFLYIWKIYYCIINSDKNRFSFFGFNDLFSFSKMIMLKLHYSVSTQFVDANSKFFTWTLNTRLRTVKILSTRKVTTRLRTSAQQKCITY